MFQIYLYWFEFRQEFPREILIWWYESNSVNNNLYANTSYSHVNY